MSKATHPETIAARARLVGHIETSLALALSSLTGAEFIVAARSDGSESPALAEKILWQQAFSIVEGPALWIAAGKDLWEAMGRLTLEGAGVETVAEEDCRSTWLEIVSQTIAGVATGITADAEREVTAGSGEELKAEPPEAEWVGFDIKDAGGKTWVFEAAWSRGLAEIYEARAVETRIPGARDSAVSKTFDLLLEVALPVSVSFGKTSLQIREILKLNTGSIVELDRFVNDPVEVIVNDCVIARGEVVVVDGNYAVRINELASREDRMKTGISENHRIGARP